MKPESIIIAATELLEEILNSSKPANEIINLYTRSRRYIGSKDRKKLTDFVWNYIRHRSRLDYSYPNKSIFEKINLIDNLNSLKFPFHIAVETPEWLIPFIPNAKNELPALLEDPKIILRANGDRQRIQKKLIQEGIETQKTTLSPFGLILKKRANLNATNCYKEGLIEVQDEGSQCVALETGIKPGDKILDYCAGAGGKSLIFTQMMNNHGIIIAHDISNRSLNELQKRAERAHITCIQIQKEITENNFDHVVVDAPCSGTGTWRRCPDMRWKLTLENFHKLLKTQEEILNLSCRHVKKGGFLSYMTCSLTKPENSDQSDLFLKKHPDFVLIKKRQFSPALTGTDGLFIAKFQKIK